MTWYVTVPGASTQWNEPASIKHLLRLTASEQFHKHICSFTDLSIPKFIGLASKPFIYLALLLHKLCVAQAKQGFLLSARFWRFQGIPADSGYFLWHMANDDAVLQQYFQFLISTTKQAITASIMVLTVSHIFCTIHIHIESLSTNDLESYSTPTHASPVVTSHKLVSGVRPSLKPTPNQTEPTGSGTEVIVTACTVSQRAKLY